MNFTDYKKVRIMKRERINYSDIIDLGFKEEYSSCNVYFNQYGYEYVIITKKLTSKIYIDWAKETGFCRMYRIDNKKECNIQNEMLINDLQHLKEIINFFCEKQDKNKEPITKKDFATFA